MNKRDNDRNNDDNGRPEKLRDDTWRKEGHEVNVPERRRNDVIDTLPPPKPQKEE